MQRLSTSIMLVVCVLGLIGASPGEAAGRIPVVVSIVPQKYFVEKIGGDLVDVSIMVRAGASPATYEPKPSQMVALSRAKIYCAIGVPFEAAWLKKIVNANPEMHLVHTQKGIEKRPMKAHHLHEGREGNDRERLRYEHGEKYLHSIKDPHVWTSPPLVMILARNILMALLRVDPAHASIFEGNYKKFILELVDLDAEIRGILSDRDGRVRFVVFHPAWGYFADAYGLEQVPIQIEGKDPKPGQLHRLIDEAKKLGVRAIFVQPQFSTKSAETIARALGGEVVFANPLRLDWAENLRKIARMLRSALR